MSPYATHLAHARLDALRQLVAALNQAETPDEKRRCAVAIFNAPNPCDLDDQIELEDDDTEDDECEDTKGENSDADGPPDVEETPGAEDAPPQEDPALTSDIRHLPSDIPPVNFADMSEEEIIAKATAILKSSALGQLVAPS